MDVERKDVKNTGSEAVDLRGSTLVKNILFNVLGIGIPLVVGFVTVPFIIKAMGLERFGILSLIWVVIGYFNFMDLGLSRATTKYIAEALGQGHLERIPEYVGTTMALQGLLGLIGTACFILLTPVIAEKILNIPEAFIPEVKTSFLILAFSIPIILLSSSLRGILEAAQRFDLVNVVKIPVSASFYVLPLAGLAVGFRLPGIIGLMVLSRLISLLVWARHYARLFPALAVKWVFRRSLVKSLLSFGGWVSLSSVVFTIVNSIDRFIIGSIRTVREVSFYTAPQEVVNKFGVIPGSLSLILFPAFSSLQGDDKEGRSTSLYVRSLKYSLMWAGPIALLFTFISKPFLNMWLGPEFSASSTLILQLLSMNFLVNSLSGVPFNFLQGTGKVKLVTQLQVIELLVFLPLAFYMVRRWGVPGIAGALVVKSLLVTAALLMISQKHKRIRKAAWIQNGFWRSGATILCGSLFLGVCSLMGWKWVGAILILPAFAFADYFWVLDSQEKQVLLGVFLGRWFRREKRKSLALPAKGPDKMVLCMMTKAAAKNKTFPKIAIILLNWNGWRDTVDCLSSLLSLDYPDFQIICIDNNSENDSVDQIRKWGARHETLRVVEYVREESGVLLDVPEIQKEKNASSKRLVFIRAKRNLGFSGGNNIGLKYSLSRGYDYAWLLNTDTIVAPDALGTLVCSAESDERIGAVGSRLIQFGTLDETQSLGEDSFFARGGKIVSALRSSRRQNPEWIWAASLLVKASCLRDVGLLAEDYFFTAEDADWCLRARRKGYLLVVAHESRVWHKEKKQEVCKRRFLGRDITISSFGHFKQRGFYEIRNPLAFSIRHRPLHLAFHLIGDAFLFLKIILFFDNKFARLKVLFAAVRDGLFLKMGKNEGA